MSGNDSDAALDGRAVTPRQLEELRGQAASVVKNDVTTPDAMNYIDERLKALGVHRLLARAGAIEGTVVHIGTFSFEYTPES